MWKIIRDPAATAAANMRRDAELLENLEEPIIRFYDWKGDALTFGHFVKIEEIIDLGKAQKRGLDVAKRPTGGGVVFHLWDLAFSVLLPATSSHFSPIPLENYLFVNRAVLKAVEPYVKNLSLEPSHDARAVDNFCMAKPTKYDVMCGGKKIAGAAQRKTKRGFLHQGTISLVMPPRDYLEDLLFSQETVDTILESTFPLLSSSDRLSEIKEELKERLIQHL